MKVKYSILQKQEMMSMQILPQQRISCSLFVSLKCEHFFLPVYLPSVPLVKPNVACVFAYLE